MPSSPPAGPGQGRGPSPDETYGADLTTGPGTALGPAAMTISGYRVLSTLGAGGMGTVYAARHPRVPRIDALKVLAEQYSADPEFRARFEREADIAADLDHPHILQVFDRGEDHGRLWMSMKLVRGTDAEALLHRSPQGLDVTSALTIIDAVARALDYAHRRNLLHRDVKPANILIADQGRQVLLADFGIARPMGRTRLTATGMTIGTVDYCSPEQLTGSPLDGRADQYSLTCTAFALFTGRAPFDAPSNAGVIGQHMVSEPPRISQFRPDTPAAVDAVLARAMAKEPDDRFARCSDFADALRAAFDAPPPSQPLPVLDPATEYLDDPTAAMPPRTPTRPPMHQQMRRRTTDVPGGFDDSATEIRGPALVGRSGPADGATRRQTMPPTAAPPPFPPPPPGGGGPRPGEPRSRRGPLLLLSLAVAALVAFGAGGYILVSKNNEGTDTATTATTSAETTPSSATESTSTRPLPAPAPDGETIVDEGVMNACKIPQSVLTAAGLQEFKTTDTGCIATTVDGGHAVSFDVHPAGKDEEAWARFTGGEPLSGVPGWRHFKDATDCFVGYAGAKDTGLLELSMHYASSSESICDALTNVARAVSGVLPPAVAAAATTTAAPQPTYTPEPTWTPPPTTTYGCTHDCPTTTWKPTTTHTTPPTTTWEPTTTQTTPHQTTANQTQTPQPTH